MTDAKQKAQEIYFHHWFEIYSKLAKQAQLNALDEIDKKRIFDPENSTYWSEVKKNLLLIL
jgi:hypothetical protein